MRYIIVLVLLWSLPSHAQWKNYMIGVKGDTLNRVDMKGKKQGPWVVHVDDLRGERGYEEEGVFVDDKKEGPWRRYSLDGDLIAIENYRWGQKNGKNIYFTNTGQPEHEESWRAIDPKNPIDTVNIYDVNDPSKIIGAQLVKMDVKSVKHGTWVYYNTETGTVEKEEVWDMDKLKTKPSNDDDMAPLDVTKNNSQAQEKKPVAKPKEVLEYEKKNAGKRKIRVRDGSTGG